MKTYSPGYLHKKKLGKAGEAFVLKKLFSKGFREVKRNFSCKYGEIDLILENKENIIFVEVKTRSKKSELSGSNIISFYKKRRILKTANYFLIKNSEHLKKDKNLRFDVAIITKSQEEKGFEPKYIENAFSSNF